MNVRLLSLRRRESGRSRSLTAGAVSVLVATAGLVPITFAAQQAANAAVTSPVAGAVIRDAGPVSIVENRGGQYANSTANACNGSTPLRSPQASGRIRVIRVSDNTEVLNVNHITTNGFTVGGSNNNGPFTAPWNTATAQPGMYRIISTATDVTRANSSAQCIGTTSVLSDFTVEYRPWQAIFNDILGTGAVKLNASPKEAQWKVKGKNSPLVTYPNATGNMHLFAAPSASLLDLPEDPSDCLADPMGCLPADAILCNGPCVPRFVVTGYADGLGANSLTGVFDLKTKAFIALARAGGTSRVLLSLGPNLDAFVNSFMGKLIQGLSNGSGVHLPSILATTVRVRLFNDPIAERSTEIEVSLAELLTISRDAGNGPNGVNVLAPFSLGIGQIIHSYSYAQPASFCGTYTGYKVTASQLVPTLPPAIVPLAPPLLVIFAGGQLKHIDGDYPKGTGSHAAGPTIVGPEIDTAPDASTGLPLWLPVANAAGTIADSDIDFVGWGAGAGGEVRVPPIPFILPQGACIGLGAMLGTGVALFGDKPLSLKTLPLLWNEQNPKVVELINKINSYTSNALANPQVQAALGAILALIAQNTPAP